MVYFSLGRYYMGQSPFYNPFFAAKNLQVFGIVAGEQNDGMQNHLLLPKNLKYTAWKVDVPNPMYWFIIAPYEKSTFWEWLAICFHYSVSIISIHGLSWNSSQRSMIPCWVKQATTFIKSNAFIQGSYNTPRYRTPVRLCPVRQL